MSTELETIKFDKRDLEIIEYWGGKEFGAMLQLTQGSGVGPDEPGFIQVTQVDAYKLIIKMAEWLKTRAASRAGELRESIAADKALEKTLTKDAVDCEHFIADLRILKLPLRLLK